MSLHLSLSHLFHNISSGGSEVILPSVPGNTVGSGIQGLNCLDIHGRVIARGVHYVPGPDACVHCVCDVGGPQLCRAILCGQPPEKRNCKPTRVGTSCCEFICPDEDWLTNGISPSAVDMGIVVPKIIITAILSLLSISLLLFLVNRLRQRGRMAANLELRRVPRDGGVYDDFDTRSIDFALHDYGRNAAGFGYPPQYMAWWRKPYFPPTGEAPPPYEEAITASALPLSTIPAPPGTLSAAASKPQEAPVTDLQLTPVTVTSNIDAGPSSSSEQNRTEKDGAKPKRNLPPYSDVATSSHYRRSLTLPRRPNLIVNPREESLQRHSLQLDITGWNASSSSSSSPSPNVGHNPPSPSSSSSSSET